MLGDPVCASDVAVFMKVLVICSMESYYVQMMICGKTLLGAPRLCSSFAYSGKGEFDRHPVFRRRNHVQNSLDSCRKHMCRAASTWTVLGAAVISPHKVTPNTAK